MAAPSGTSWGSIVGNYGKLGIYVGISNTSTTTSVTVEIWIATKYSLSDKNNSLYFDNLASSGSASTSRGSVSINTTNNSGSGWSTSNQQKLASYSYSYTRGTSAVTRYLYSRLDNIDYIGAKLYASTTFSVPKLDSYTIAYNANGGSGAPSSQTKYYGKNITLSSTKPTRTGYSFQGWGTSSSDTSVDYSAGATYSANASITLYAIWKANTYTVSYNANGGSGAPSSQTKTYGVDLTLSSTKPTRTDYNFKGWGTSASATTVSYASGAKYTSNAAITLYAIWEIAYIKPRITKFKAYRCDSSGNELNDGTYIKVTFSWATDKSVSAIKIEYKKTTDSSWTVKAISTSGGTSGSVSQIIGSGSIDVEYAYIVQITVTDESGSNQDSRTVGSLAYPIDVLNEGKGVAFGKVAEMQNYMDIAYSVNARNPIESVYSDEIGFIQTNSKSNNSIAFGIGSSGYNRGIYDRSQKKWLIYANSSNDVGINTSGNVTVNGMLIAKNKVLWSGAYYMNASQTITLSSAISKQANGIILVFSGHDSDTGTVKNSGIHCHFVPKEVVSIYSGAGHNISFMQYTGNEYIYKYLYISDTQITGHDTNGTQITTTSCAVKTLNRQSVLTRVIGI